nr:hypothetical protein [uncultured Blautia sp.]
MKNTNKKSVVISALFIFILFVIAVVMFQVMKPEDAKNANGVAGKIVDNWDTGIPEQTDEPEESTSGGIQIPGYSKAEMEEGDTQLHLSIGNPKENNCGFYVTVRLEDGTVLYKSELLKPGYGLTEIPLEQTLNKGTYDAEVFYECVTLDEDASPLNSAISKFQLIVN